MYRFPPWNHWETLRLCKVDYFIRCVALRCHSIFQHRSSSGMKTLSFDRLLVSFDMVKVQLLISLHDLDLIELRKIHRYKLILFLALLTTRFQSNGYCRSEFVFDKML